jgi:UDP-N-acetylglucosamine--N-acetylmuramyl-(pentapeptide) pyrophosphoryl-undecaprenol N-acetylglucosamine transferase
MDKRNIIFCGGGTGGHYYPLMAIKNELEKKMENNNLYYIGSKYGIESKKIISENMKSLLIPIKGFNRSFSLYAIARNCLLFFELFFGLVKVSFFFMKNKPSLVIATGGYASFIPLQIAKIFNVPYFLHEQNSFPGLVTRIFGSKARKVFLGFDNAKKYLKNSDILFTGNPIYNHSQKDMSLSLDQTKRTVLILGGSQGSVFLNNIISECIDNKMLNNINIIWIAGLKHYDKYKHYNTESIKVLSFVDNMPYLYDICDLIVSRSGAMTVSEILEFKKPSILIPFRFAAENHQVFNAKYLEEKFAALLIEEKDLTISLLSKKINEICKNDRVYSSMKQNIERINNPDSIKIISNSIMEHLHAI